MWNVEPKPVQPEAALRWFRSKLPLTDTNYKALEDTAKARGFTVSGLASLDLVQDVLRRLQTALEDGVPFDQWQRELPNGIKKAWGKDSAYRLKTIFDTNLQDAYGAGRYKAAIESKRPYLGLETVLDGRTSKICLGFTGVVLPASDPFWKTHRPPFHYQCRTTIITFDREQAEARGITTKLPTVKPLEGFGAAPDLETGLPKAFVPDKSKYHPDLWAAYEGGIAKLELNHALGMARAYDVPAAIDSAVFVGADENGIAAFVPTRKRIELNPNHVYWKNPARVLETDAFSTQSPQHVIRHEVAHARIWAFDPENYEKLRAMTWDDLPFADAGSFGTRVSDAASLSPGEFVSEVFAGLEHGKMYDEDVIKLYELLHGGAL